MCIFLKAVPLLMATAWACNVPHLLAEDLKDIYRMALQHDAKFSADQAKFYAELELILQRRSQLLPQITIEAQSRWSKIERDQAMDNLGIDQANHTYGLQLVQPLFRWNEWSRYKQGQKLEVLAAAQLANARQRLLLRVAQAYFEALYANDVHQTAEKLKAAEAQQLTIVLKNFKLGALNILDVHEIQASFDKTTADLIEAEIALQESYYDLARITGSRPGRLLDLRDDLMLISPLPADVDNWIRAAVRDNLDVQARKFQLIIAQHEVSSQEAGHLPTIDIVAGFNNRSSSSSNINQQKSSSVALRFSMPLYAGGRTTAAVRSAKASHAQAEAELDDAKRGAVANTRKAWLGMVSGFARIRALETAKISMKSALDSNRIGYKVGLSSISDVLKAQVLYSETVQRLARAKYDTLLSKITLKYSVGSLNENDLDEINLLLGP